MRSLSVVDSGKAAVPADKYLDGLVAAISRVGLMVTTLSVISGLILVVCYVDNFSFDEPQHQVATKIREMFEARIKVYDDELMSGFGGQLVALSEVEGRKAREDAIHYRSVLYYKVARIKNELGKVDLGKVKLPILNHEVPANDSSVVLAFFLVIISLVTLITVSHINDALDDARLLSEIRQNMVFLRSRLILIYAPITGGHSALWIYVIFFLPCGATFIAFSETVYLWLSSSDSLADMRMLDTAILRAILLGFISLFLGYVGFALRDGWLKLRKALGE